MASQSSAPGAGLQPGGAAYPLAEAPESYQGWPAPQCGQATVVETDATNTKPHSQE